MLRAKEATQIHEVFPPQISAQRDPISKLWKGKSPPPWPELNGTPKNNGNTLGFLGFALTTSATRASKMWNGWNGAGSVTASATLKVERIEISEVWAKQAFTNCWRGCRASNKFYKQRHSQCVGLVPAVPACTGCKTPSTSRNRTLQVCLWTKRRVTDAWFYIPFEQAYLSVIMHFQYRKLSAATKPRYMTSF